MAENVIFQQVQLKILKRDSCPWCKQLLVNVEQCKKMFIEQGYESKLVNQIISVQEQPQGRVPQICVRFNFPHASNHNYIFTHDNEDRTSCTLMTVIMYFATVIYPETYWRTKFSPDLLQLLTKTFTIKRVYPLSFIPYEQIQGDILDLRNTGLLLDNNNNPTSADLHSESKCVNEIFQLNDLDIMTLFYYVNQKHTRLELEKNIKCNSELLAQLHREEQQFRLLDTLKT